ncbi:MAG: hypothetical protein Q3X09_07275, partial [Gemmiger sp.]|nr:hypothetical protein [Gemmiger sp.]
MAAAVANTIVRNPKSTLYYKMLQSICQFYVRFQTTTKSRKPAPQAADFRERCPFAEFLQNFLSFLKKTLDFPGGGRYNKTRSPARTPSEYAPVAQLDRVSDYE